MISLDNGDKLQGDTATASKVDYTIQGVVGTTLSQQANGQLPSSIGDLYTSSADATVVAGITLVNTNTSAEAVNLYLLPSGGTARRIIPKDLSLGVDHSLIFDGNVIQVLNAEGEILYAISDTGRAANYVVAANGAPAHVKTQADYVCDATDDHVQIQAAIDALPATGGKVLLTEGTFTNEAAITLDSYQTLQGMGRSTILTTTTANLDIITATGSSGSEKVGITLADFCIDGDAGSATNDEGILWTYVDNSEIRNVWSIDNGESGIELITSDQNRIVGANCHDNTNSGIILDNSIDNRILGNVCTGNAYGIQCYWADTNTILGNTCKTNTVGIMLDTADYCVVAVNTVIQNSTDGIHLCTGNHNTIEVNFCTESSQGADDTHDDITVEDNANYNNVQGNTCRAGGETNKPKYGININGATCDGNKVINNDLYDDGFVTAPFADSGTGTIYVEPGIDDTPVNGETGQPISSNWAFDHNAAVLSTTVHNNNNYFLGYGNETVTDPTLNAVVKIPALTAITDPVSGLDVSDWYGASGAYRQSDADSDATHIEDDDASFPASMQFTLVKWASNAAGDADVGIGYVSSVTDSDTLVIAKFTGADFAASYYYWIKHSEWVVPVTGIYYVKAAVLFLPSEADKRFEARIWYYTGTSAPAQLLQGVASSGLADYEFPTISGIVSLTANAHLFSIGQHGGTSGTPNIYTSHVAHLPLQAFLLKQTA